MMHLVVQRELNFSDKQLRYLYLFTAKHAFMNRSFFSKNNSEDNSSLMDTDGSEKCKADSLTGGNTLSYRINKCMATSKALGQQKSWDTEKYYSLLCVIFLTLK